MKNLVLLIGLLIATNVLSQNTDPIQGEIIDLTHPFSEEVFTGLPRKNLNWKRLPTVEPTPDFSILQTTSLPPSTAERT